MLRTNKIIIKFLSLLLSVLLLTQCFQSVVDAKPVNKHPKKSSKLLLRSAKINGSVIDKSRNLLVIKDAVGLSNIVYIKHTKKRKPVKGDGIPLQATLNGCDLEINLEKIAPISFLPNGKYIVTATRGTQKLRAKFRLRSPKLAGGLFRVFKNPNVKLSSTLRQQLVSSSSTSTGGLTSTSTTSSTTSTGGLTSTSTTSSSTSTGGTSSGVTNETVIRTFDYNDLTVEISPPTNTSVPTVSTTTNGAIVQQDDFVTEFYPDQTGVVTGEISENGTNFELSAIISNDYNNSSSSSGSTSDNSNSSIDTGLTVKASDLYVQADITLSSTYLAEAAKAIETFVEAKDPNADFSAGIFVAEANEKSTVSIIDTSPSLLQGSTSADVVFAINSDALLDAAVEATTSTKVDKNALAEVITKLPNLIVENNLTELADLKVIEAATSDPIAVGFLSPDSISKETAKKLLTETGVIPGFFEQITQEQLTTTINSQGALPLFEVNNTLSTDLKNVLGDTNVTIVIPGGAELNTDVVTNLNGITVIADGGSVISGSTNPGITISVTPGTLVESTATSFVKATSDVSNPILNNTADIPGLIPSEDLYGIPTSYSVDEKARVVTSGGTLKNANLVTIPTSLEAQVAISTTSSTSSTSSSGNTTSSSGIIVSSSSTSGGTTTITIPVFNPSNNIQVQQLETALTKEPKVITGAGAAPLLIVIGDKNVSKNLISILSMAIDIASATFPPIDESKVISITADPESVINSIQQALGILAGSGSSSTSSSSGGSSTSSSGGTSTSGGSISSTGGSSTSGGATNNSSSDSSVGNFFNNLGTVDISATTNSDNNTPVTQSVVTKDDLAEEPLCRLTSQ